MRPALAALALLCTLAPASAQNVMVYLSDRLEQPAYAFAWAAMFAMDGKLPFWLRDKAKGSTQSQGRREIVDGRDVELYGACQPHNCDLSRFEVIFLDRGKRAKGVLILNGGGPQFFGYPNAAEATALLNAAS